MPELPEVETTVRGLIPVLQDSVLASVACHVPALRYPLAEDFADRLQGRRIHAIRRRAKYMLLETDDGQMLIIHLGMSGSMRITTPDTPREKHEHVVFTTERGASVRFNDPRRFGFMELTTAAAIDDHAMLRNLGPEPLGNHFNATALAQALAGRRSPIKAALLDQRTVAGLGNIYVCEALYWAGISPRRLSCNVGAPRVEALVTAIRRVLGEAIEAGGSSLRDFRHADGELGYFQKQFAVYGREGESCPRCPEACAIKRIVQSGRSTFYCPRHQR
ncbi:MAG: bifunctional DNA-formamidopyrimidine glycosylase/DNA-(apurinic or apyrimidinic site) lyase [Alphaproteobacteria bacterium]